MPATLVYSDLIEACTQPGCPVCQLVQRLVEHFLENLFYESVNDIPLRDQLRKALGFCPVHAWLAQKPGLGDALGVAIIYHDVLTNVLRGLRGEPGASNVPTGWRGLLGGLSGRMGETHRAALQALTPQARCPACEQQDSAAEMITAFLLSSLEGKKDLVQALEGSDGLCLPHLRLALERSRSDQVAEVLLALALKRLESLDVELAEQIRKSDYRYQGEPMGAERDAWMRAVRTVVGEKPYK